MYRISLTLIGGLLFLASLQAPAAPLDLASDEFPIGLYSVDSEGAMAQVKEMGVDYVHTYALGADTTPEALAKYQAYMDAARKHGLRVMVYLNGRRWVSNHGLLEMHKIVMALKDHPALGFWLLYDEPSGTHTPRDLMPFYWLLKYETPQVPVAIVEAWAKDWWEDAKACDLLQLDAYPVKNEEFPTSPIGNVTTFVGRGVKLGSVPIMPVLQCYNRKVMDLKDTATSEEAGKFRYPNATELYYWSYSSLAQGVRGLFWWSYYRSVQNGYGWINTEFKSAMQEVRRFVDLVKPAHKPEVFQYAPDEDVYMALYRRPTGTYLVIANGQPIARRISRGTEKLLADEATLEAWGHTRAAEAKVTEGKVMVEAQPWETFVWKVTEAPAK